MKKRKVNKFLACLLSMLILLQTGFFSLQAFAATSPVNLYNDGFRWANTIYFTNPVDGSNHAFSAGSSFIRTYLSSLGTPGYCFEPGAPIHTSGTVYSSGDTAYWYALGSLKQRAINRALFYGYPNNLQWDPGAYLGFYVTQIVIWEYVLGFRDVNTNECTNPVLINNLSAPAAYSGSLRPMYDQLDAFLRRYFTIPSFMGRYQTSAPTVTLKYNPSSGQYEGTLYDTNSLTTQSQMPLSASGITFSKLDDRTLKISTPYVISQTAPVTVSSSKDLIISATDTAPVIWSSSGSQAIVHSCGRPDPVPGYLRIQTESLGSLKIVKSAEDGAVSGKSFRITGSGVDQTVTTGADGTVTASNLNAGGYTVTETGTPVQYNQPTAQTITVLPGQTVTANFTNTLKKGRIKFTKQDSYSGGYLTGAKYRIYKSNGTCVCELTSDASQFIYSPLLPYGSYYLQENAAPTGFAVDSKQYPFSITSSGQVVTMQVSDAPTADVYPTFIEPNVYYYHANSKIMVSYLIHNDSVAEHTPDHPLTVSFRAYYVNPRDTTDKIDIYSEVTTVVVPRQEQNLVYFTFELPERISNINFTCTVDIPSGVVETNTANNTDSQSMEVRAVTDSQTPNTQFESTPVYFNKPDENASSPFDYATIDPISSATWEQWECYYYTDGKYDRYGFVKKKYGIVLSADQQILPDINSLSHYQQTGLWHMRSGYGISLTASTSAVQFLGADFPNASAYILPQAGSAYLPEYGYEQENGKYRSLQLTAANKLEFEPNPYSITKQGVNDNRRIHYTPLWYPDGTYTVKTDLYDCWTPAGMLSLQSTLQPVIIGGSIYDDWYINHVG